MPDILIVVVAAAAVTIMVILAYADSKPDAFVIRRQAMVHAPSDKIFPLLNDLHLNTRWSPFEKDPAVKRTHSGAPQGVGAVYEWDGNKEVGAGRIEIIESTPPSQVAMTLEMFRPFAARNRVEFTLEPKGALTAVTWAMSGRTPFIGKVINLIVNCEKMVGRDFEKGLANLKSLAESGDARAA